jgi:glutamyl-tRNA synthetase
MILQALKLHTPQYGHLSLITGDDGTPLSKRHGSFSLHDLRESGYLPQAVLNYLARLSHTYEEQTLMTFDELAAHFSLERLSRASARFDKNQLLHWQKETVMKLDREHFRQWIGDEKYHAIPESLRDPFMDVICQNVIFPKEADAWFDIFFGNQVAFLEDQQAILKEAGETFFVTLQEAAGRHGADLKIILDEVKQKSQVSGKKLFMPVRVALTGQLHGPELLQIVNLLGREKMRERFEIALEWVRKHHAKSA